jgi:hypothetical protein
MAAGTFRRRAGRRRSGPAATSGREPSSRRAREPSSGPARPSGRASGSARPSDRAATSDRARASRRERTRRQAPLCQPVPRSDPAQAAQSDPAWGPASPWRQVSDPGRARRSPSGQRSGPPSELQTGQSTRVARQGSVPAWRRGPRLATAGPGSGPATLPVKPTGARPPQGWATGTVAAWRATTGSASGSAPSLDVADGRGGGAVWTHDRVGGRDGATPGAAEGLADVPVPDPGACEGAATGPGNAVTPAGSALTWVDAFGGVAGVELAAAAGATSAGSSGPSAT